eukprot:16276416-Heterocapsa_arctica.AAC.1
MAKRSERKPCPKPSKFSHTKGLRQTRPDKNTLEEDNPEDRLEEEPIDKSDTEYMSCVEKNLNIYQDNIDQTYDRDRQ